MTTLTIEKIRLSDLTIVAFTSLIIGLFSQISIPLWFTPIPLATQNIVILAAAALLGARRAFAATVLFLIEGAAGFPFFAGGAAGLAVLIGPRGGYLLGYAIAAFITGYLFEKKKHPLIALAAGQAIIFALGASYLATFIGWQKAIALGVAPFLFGDFLKTIACWKLLSWKR
jgi:biotin transport system substrate-specific component